VGKKNSYLAKLPFRSRNGLTLKCGGCYSNEFSVDSSTLYMSSSTFRGKRVVIETEKDPITGRPKLIARFEDIKYALTELVAEMRGKIVVPIPFSTDGLTML
jgi:hypothetical protein